MRDPHLGLLISLSISLAAAWSPWLLDVIFDEPEDVIQREQRASLDRTQATLFFAFVIFLFL